MPPACGPERDDGVGCGPERQPLGPSEPACGLRHELDRLQSNERRDRGQPHRSGNETAAADRTRHARVLYALAGLDDRSCRRYSSVSTLEADLLSRSVGTAHAAAAAT